MICGLSQGNGGRALARHLASDENEHVEILESNGLFATTIDEQIAELTDLTRHARTNTPLLHAHMSPEPGQPWSAEHSTRAWADFERAHGVEGNKYMAVQHFKKDRLHEHRVYVGLTERGTKVRLGWDRIEREYMSRKIELREGHPLIKGRFNQQVFDRAKTEDPALAAAMKSAGLLDGKPAIARMTPAERMQQKQNGVSVSDVRTTALEAFRSADSGASFRAALADKELHLAQGKSQVLIVDSTGAHHGLNRVLRAAARDAGQEPISAADSRAMLSGIQLPPLAAVQASVRGEQNTGTEDRKHGSKEARAPSGPSIGHGGEGGPAASVDASNIAPIDPDKPGDFERFLRQFAADVEKKNAAAHQIQMAAIKRGSLGSAEAAQRLAAILQRALTHTIREGERHARHAERRTIYEASKLAAAGRYSAAIEQFEQAWQSLSESLVDRRPIGDPSSDDPAADGHATDTGPTGVKSDGLRGDRGSVDEQQPVAAPEPVGAATGAEREPADPRVVGEHHGRSDGDLRAAISNRVEDARRELELGRPDASERLQRLVVQSAAMARQQHNPAAPEQPENAHQRLKREFSEYRQQHKNREKARWSTAFSRQREIAGVARALLQRGDGWLAPAAARQLRAATTASNTRLRDVLQQTKPTLDTYAAFVSRKAELGDPSARQVHQFIVRREEQKQTLLAEVDRVRDARLKTLSADPWPDDRSRNAKLLADDARRALEKPRAVALKKVAGLDAAAERAEALIGPADRLARSLGIITDGVRAAEAARHQADAARGKLEPAETYEFRLRAATAAAENTAQQRQAEHDKWRDQDVKKAERDLEIAHRIDAAIQANDREICRCGSYADAVRVIEERLKKERADRLQQELECQREQEQNMLEAGPSLGPRMR